MKTTPFFQQAYLVNDLDAAITHWHQTFGAGPFVKAEHHKTDRFDYRGTNHEADVSYAFGYLGDMQIQFIVQHDSQAPTAKKRVLGLFHHPHIN